MKQTIVPCLWFVNNNAEEAMNYYISVFPNSRIVDILYYPVNGDQIDEHLAGMQGKVLTGIFELNGQRYMCLDGGNQGFNFNHALSMVIECENQTEIDYYWSKLSDDPASEQCGWCIDKYGLSWQIVPRDIKPLMANDEQVKAMMRMKKIDIVELESLA